MGRAPCCEKVGLKRGPWTPAEDLMLMAYIHKYGHGNWRALPKQAGLLRCGKSCRLRWINYLRPDIKRGNFTPEEEEAITMLHGLLGNKWSKIASKLPGRTDNEIKNVWNTHLKKRLLSKGAAPPHSRVLGTKETSCSSFSSSESTLSSLNKCERTQDEKQAIDPSLLDVESSSETNKKEEKKEKPSSGNLIEIPVEPNLDLWDMLDEGSSRENKSKDNFNKLIHVNRELTKPSLSSSSSFSSTTSTFNSHKPNSPSGLIEMNKKKDDWKGMIESLDDRNIDFWGMLGDDDLGGLVPASFGLENEPHAQQSPTTGVEGGQSKGVVGGQRWLIDLENELELSVVGGEGDDQSSLTKGTSDEPSASSYIPYEGILEFDVDPIIAFFQSQQPSSPVYF